MLKTPKATKLLYANAVNTEPGKGLVVGIKGCEMRSQTLQFRGLHKSSLHQAFCEQDDMIPCYTRINFGPSQNPKKYVFSSVALLRCVALPSLRLYVSVSYHYASG